MSTAPRNLPRFLPTLTEVVSLPEPAVSVPVLEPLTPPLKEIVATPELEETVWFVMQRVDMVLERRLREQTAAMLESVVSDQLKLLGIQLREELEGIVRESVCEALASKVSH
jgi:hypothetical protein